MVMLATVGAEARTLEGVLGDAQERVGLRPAPAFTTFSSHLATVVTAPSLTSPSSAALAGTAPIDSTMAALGPIFLDHAATLGAGVTNANMVTQRSFADGALFGQPFSDLGLGTLPLLARRTPTGKPTAPAAVGLRLRYAVDLHRWATAVAISHGVTDSLDVSAVVPVVSTALDCAVHARVVTATAPAGGAFEPVKGAPTLGGTLPRVSSSGVGDLVVRVKRRLPVPAPWRLAAAVDAQFPTGQPLQLRGTGSYWVNPGVDLSVPLRRRGELDAHLSVDVNATHLRQTRALYGFSGSMMFWPGRLAGVVEFLGQSQFMTAFAPHATDVLVVTPQGGIGADPLLGVGWTGRLDQFDLSFGVRAIVGPGPLVVFASGVVPLNRDVGVRAAGVVPTLGLGWSF